MTVPEVRRVRRPTVPRPSPPPGDFEAMVEGLLGFFDDAAHSRPRQRLVDAAVQASALPRVGSGSKPCSSINFAVGAVVEPAQPLQSHGPVHVGPEARDSPMPPDTDQNLAEAAAWAQPARGPRPHPAVPPRRRRNPPRRRRAARPDDTRRVRWRAGRRGRDFIFTTPPAARYLLAPADPPAPHFSIRSISRRPTSNWSGLAGNSRSSLACSTPPAWRRASKTAAVRRPDQRRGMPAQDAEGFQPHGGPDGSPRAPRLQRRDGARQQMLVVHRLKRCDRITASPLLTHIPLPPERNLRRRSPIPLQNNLQVARPSTTCARTWMTTAETERDGSRSTRDPARCSAAWPNGRTQENKPIFRRTTANARLRTRSSTTAGL